MIKKTNIFFNIFIITILSTVTLLTFIPLALIVVRGVANLQSALQSNEILFSIGLSFKTAIISTSICLFFALPTAYGLSKLDFPFKKTVSIILYLPMSFPHLVSGIALLLLFANTKFGGFLSKHGIDFIFTVNGIIAAQVFVNMPYMLKMLKGNFDNVNSKTEFIARTLGCNKWQSFFHVTLPLIKRGMTSAIVMTWSKSLGEFGAVMMLAGATRFKTETLPIAIFLNISTGNLDLAITIATILIIISFISIMIFEMLDKEVFN